LRRRESWWRLSSVPQYVRSWSSACLNSRTWRTSENFVPYFNGP